MTDSLQPPDEALPEQDIEDPGAIRSPIRPRDPQPDIELPPIVRREPPPPPPEPASEMPTEDPKATLEAIRQDMENVANEFAAGKLNRAQFNAIYRHYSEKRSIIEKLLERDPDSNAWQSVAQPGKTEFLRDHFEARPVYFVVYGSDLDEPLFVGGERMPDTVAEVEQMVEMLRRKKRRGSRLGQKEIGNDQWLILATGEHGLTMVVFSLQPSSTQMNLVRDLHRDFERANWLALKRGQQSNRMVFPQRSLLG